MNDRSLFFILPLGMLLALLFLAGALIHKHKRLARKVDPLFKARIYLALGRKKAAIRVLETALEAAPETRAKCHPRTGATAEIVEELRMLKEK